MVPRQSRPYIGCDFFNIRRSMKIKEIKNVFDKYACQYNFDEILIKLKYEHSYRVMNICKEIAEDLNLGKEDVELAMVIGLLHDYARFEQWKQFKTFNNLFKIMLKRFFNIFAHFGNYLRKLGVNFKAVFDVFN